METLSIQLTKADALHVARSKMLDEFAKIEEAVVGLMLRAKCTIKADHLSQKIQVLRATKPTPQYSRAKRAQVLPLLDQLEPLLALRNDIVHSAMRIANIDGDPHASFRNVRTATEPTGLARLITLDQFETVRRDVHRFAIELLSPIPPNPASSPPPPSPDATADP